MAPIPLAAVPIDQAPRTQDHVRPTTDPARDPEATEVLTESAPVHHRIEGRDDGPAVVLSNSLGTTHRMWDLQTPALGVGHRVVRYDTRGHGASPVPPGPYAIDELADDLLALLDRLQIARAHLVGLSLGGMTVLSLAARHPDRVASLSLLCTSAMLHERHDWPARAAAVRADGTEAVADTVVGRWFTPGFVARQPGLAASYRSMMVSTPAEGYAACCDAIAAMDQRDRLGSIAARTLVVAGADDEATPPDHLAGIAAGIASARLVVLDDAAHLANVERSDQVTRLLLDHVDAGSLR